MPEKFKGFQAGQVNMTQIPAPFFEDLMPLVDSLAELKVLLFCFWALPQKEGPFPYLLRRDFLHHAPLMNGLAGEGDDAEAVLDAALESALAREALLSAEITYEGQPFTLYFVNTAKGRTAIQQIAAGEWVPVDMTYPAEVLPERPNIYRVYEENFGVLTPMLADELKDMAATFDERWILEAFKEAMTNNKRSLRYVRAILENWRKEGRQQTSKDRTNRDDDGQRYVSGRFADFINH
ncbi:MAG: hypothetical protein OHK0046_28370 [Anaerolineae bacterium]